MSIAQKIRSLYKHVGPALLDQAIVSGGNFAVGIIFARYLGLEALGQFSLLWIMLFLAIDTHRALVIMPFLSIAPKQSPNAPYFQDINNDNIWISLLLSLFLGGGIMLSNLIMPSWALTPYSVTMIFLGFSRLLHEFARRYYFTQKTPHMALIIDSISFVVIGGLIIYYIYQNNLSLLSILQAHTIGYGSAFLFAFIQSKTLRDFSVPKSFPAIQRHWDMSKWLLPNVAMQYLSNNYLIVIGAAFLSPVVAGIIRILQYLFGPLSIIYQGLNNILPVHAAEKHGIQGLHETKKYLHKSSLLMMALTLIYGSLIVSFGRPVVSIIMNKTMPDYFWQLSLIYVGLFLCFSWSLNQIFLLRTLEKTKGIFYGYSITACLVVLFSSPVIKAYGLFGIVGGLFISKLFFVITLWFMTKHHSKEIEQHEQNPLT